MANEKAQDSKKLPRIPPSNFGGGSMFGKPQGFNPKAGSSKGFVPSFRINQNKGSGGK